MVRTVWRPPLTENTGAAPLLGALESLINQRTRPSPTGTSMVLQHHDAVLFGYWALASGEKSCISYAVSLLNKLIEMASSLPPVSFRRGLVGLGWTIEHLSALLDSRDQSSDSGAATGEADPIAELDMLLLRELERTRWTGRLDAAEGLIGLALYFLERLPCPSANLGVELVAYHIGKAAETEINGVFWCPSPEDTLSYCSGSPRLDCCRLTCDIIYLLDQMNAAGISNAADRRHSEEGMSWVLPIIASLSPAESDYFLPRVPYFLDRADQTGNGALQYCAHCILESALRDPYPISQNRHCKARLLRGHIINRVFNRTSDERYLKLATDSFTVASSDAMLPTNDDTERAVDPVYWLSNSVAGRALMVLSAVAQVEPRWDKLVMFSGA